MQEHHTSRYDITLYVTKHTEEIHFELVYALRYFETKQMERMKEQFLQLLKSLIDQPMASVYNLNISSPAEQAQQALAWADFLED